MNEPKFYTYIGIDLARRLVDTMAMQPIDSTRKSGLYHIRENDANFNLAVQLEERVQPENLLTPQFFLHYFDSNYKELEEHKLPGLRMIKEDLRATLPKYVGPECTPPFGRQELPKESRNLLIFYPEYLATKMADELQALSQRKGTCTSAEYCLAQEVRPEDQNANPEYWSPKSTEVSLMTVPVGGQRVVAFVRIVNNIRPYFTDLRPLDDSLPPKNAIKNILRDVVKQISEVQEMKTALQYIPVTSFFRETDPLAAAAHIELGENTLAHCVSEQSLLFAYVLNRLLGYDIWGIYSLGDEDATRRLIHAYCRTGDIYLDGRGSTTDKTHFFAPWATRMGNGYQIIRIDPQQILPAPSQVELTSQIAEYVRQNYHEFLADEDTPIYSNKEFVRTLYFRGYDPIDAMRAHSMGADDLAQLALGQSVIFAYALSCVTGYAMECLCEPAAPGEGDTPWYSRVIHAYCRKGNILIDARGATEDRKQFFEPWQGMLSNSNETVAVSVSSAIDAIDRYYAETRRAQLMREAECYILAHYHDLKIN